MSNLMIMPVHYVVTKANHSQRKQRCVSLGNL